MVTRDGIMREPGIRALRMWIFTQAEGFPTVQSEENIGPAPDDQFDTHIAPTSGADDGSVPVPANRPDVRSASTSGAVRGPPPGGRVFDTRRASTSGVVSVGRTDHRISNFSFASPQRPPPISPAPRRDRSISAARLHAHAHPTHPLMLTALPVVRRVVISPVAPVPPTIAARPCFEPPLFGMAGMHYRSLTLDL